jgi:uncharacterized membrane protein
VVAGALWVGFLFFFAFIFSPIMASLGPSLMKSVYPPVMKRVITWVHAIVGLTFLSGLLLLGMVYHGGGLMFEEGSSWGMLAGVYAIGVFLVFIPYDIWARSSSAASLTVAALVLSLLTFGMFHLMIETAGFTYRAAMIHVGIMLGAIMAGNAGRHMIPAQRRMIAAFEGGSAPDPKDIALLQTRGMHNVVVTVPLVYTMLNQHTVVPGASSPVWFLGVLVVNWLVVSFLVGRSKPAS